MIAASPGLTFDTVQQEESSQDAANEDAKPYPGILQHMSRTESRRLIRVLGRTTGELQRSRGAARDDVEPARAEADDSEEETDTAANGSSDRSRNDTGQPLSKTEDGESEENESLQEHGGQSLSVRDGTGALLISCMRRIVFWL